MQNDIKRFRLCESLREWSFCVAIKRTSEKMTRLIVPSKSIKGITLPLKTLETWSWSLRMCWTRRLHSWNSWNHSTASSTSSSLERRPEEKHDFISCLWFQFSRVIFAVGSSCPNVSFLFPSHHSVQETKREDKPRRLLTLTCQQKQSTQRELLFWLSCVCYDFMSLILISRISER